MPEPGSGLSASTPVRGSPLRPGWPARWGEGQCGASAASWLPSARRSALSWSCLWWGFVGSHCCHLLWPGTRYRLPHVRGLVVWVDAARSNDIHEVSPVGGRVSTRRNLGPTSDSRFLRPWPGFPSHRSPVFKPNFTRQRCQGVETPWGGKGT